MRTAYTYASELYIFEDTLVVIRTGSSWGEMEDEEVYTWWNDDSTEAVLYDVSDPASPHKTSKFGQDGYYLTSRLYDGVLYLVSSYNLYHPLLEDEPETYIPRLWQDDAEVLIAADDICICPDTSESYTVICSIDLATETRLSEQAALGSGSVVYMNENNLYLTKYTYAENTNASYTEEVYRVEEITASDATEILRFSLADGIASYAAGGQVDGTLTSQFALDEYEGYLRVVTTINRSTYTLYTDEIRGFVNYIWGESLTDNALYVLDGSMDMVSSITGLAEDETVYSVRFDGETGYFVTFRQVDPLFAVDLSDPYAPKVLSALKIPGFSEYLHVYGDGLLFGLGQDADEESGWASDLKLSMFDTSDPADVTELSTLILSADWSVALYNHKAILIDPEKDIIGFPVESGYQIYGYNDADGFYQRGEITLPEDTWYYESRGLYIGNDFYVYAYNSIYVFDLDTFSLLAEIDLPL